MALASFARWQSGRLFSGVKREARNLWKHGSTSRPSSSSSTLITAANAASVMARFDTLILDCDGVLWHVDHERGFPDVGPALRRLREAGKTLLFASNNSIPSSAAFVEKVRSMTGYDCQLEEMFSVNRVIGQRLETILTQPKDKVYAMVADGTAEELASLGLTYLGHGPEPTKPSYDIGDLTNLELDPAVKAVLVGQDKHFNFMKLAKAASYLSNPDVHFLVTSWETGFLFAPGRVQPIAGSLAQCVAAAAKREPIYLGKPFPPMLDAIQARLPGVTKERTCMIGDSLFSDSGFARKTGIASMAVLTGISTEETIREFAENEKDVFFGMPLSELVPDYHVPSIVELAGFL